MEHFAGDSTIKTDVMFVVRTKVRRVKVAQFFYKERRMITDISGGTDYVRIAHAPMFLSETELQIQGDRTAWRKGVQTTVNNLFRSPRDTPEFPRIFQNVPKRVAANSLPFTYKAFKLQKPATESIEGVKPTIVIPESGLEDPPYAPKTP